MKILEKKIEKEFPFSWVDLDYYPESKGKRTEIYLLNTSRDSENTSELILLFNKLFGELRNNIFIYNKSWWDFCLDSWNIYNEKDDYSFNNKSDETKDYFNLLIDSHIEMGFGGSCKCLNWNAFFNILLPCILTHKAPYSPLFYHCENDFFFYFHHTESIGLYFREYNIEIHKIIKTAKEYYELKMF